ncbi:hypothetical protein HG444_001065 [Candidatus Saccharibacteria bacterium]|mgnify:CR=1 FL=1|jgi:hypothetical protein|nr:hypothetical protein [Candidatus Saccharibacteria bacterium]
MFFKRKKHVTNWDVLGAVIRYAKKFGMECLLTQQQIPLESKPRKISTYEMLAVNEELLEKFHQSLHYSREAFIKYHNEFLNAYHAQKNDSHTGAGLQELLPKIKDLAEVELAQRNNQYENFCIIQQDISDVLHGLVGNGSRRVLNSKDINHYVSKLYDVLRLVSDVLPEDEVYKRALQPLNHEVNIIDILSDWYLLSNKKLTAGKDLIDSDCNYGTNPKNVEYIRKAGEAGSPTEEYMQCVEVVKDLRSYLHGFGYSTKQAFYFKKWRSLTEDTYTREDYRLSIRLQGAELVISREREFTFNNTVYPRGKGESSIAATAISILLKLDPDFYWRSLGSHIL